MESQGSVTHWINQLKAGDEAAARQLCERYFQRLLAVARTKLKGTPRRAADEEDVAQSAFKSFCLGVQRGQFGQLFNRTDLWRLLLVITVRKAIHQIRDENRQKRGGGGQADSTVPGPRGAQVVTMENLLSREPTPDMAAQLEQELERLLNCLPDEQERSIALKKMEGYTNEEISAKLACALRTVERKLHMVRLRWEKELEE